MVRSGRALTRRRFLQGGLGVALAAAAWHPSVIGGLISVPPAAAQSLPRFPGGIGRGKSVAVIGAGIAGLTSAYELLRAGFDVTVFEGTNRYGGRSLTVRPSDPDYKAWVINKHRFLDEATYCDFIPAEVRGAKVPQQTAEFVTPRVRDDYFELYFNAGPGRIPTIHTGVLHYCREFGVEMEPYIFLSQDNLLHASNFNSGRPIQVRQLLYDMMGHISELLYADVGEALSVTNAQNAARLEAQLKKFLIAFGDLTPDGAFKGTDRAGFVVPPGAGTNRGIRNPQLPLSEMLKVDALWTEVMEANRIEWQLPLLEPSGGMDMIWHAFLSQEITGAVLRSRVRLSHEVTGLTRENGTTGPITVTVSGPDGETRGEFDYVVMTGKPTFLLDMDLTNVVDASVPSLISRLLLEGGGKYAWQGRTRFWEASDLGIFGGISFTEQMIRQIWYPSDGYNGPTGILTGAYMYSPVLSGLDGQFWPAEYDYAVPVPPEEIPEAMKYASLWASLDQAGRTAAALKGGEALHPGFTENVYSDRGLSVSWDNQPFQRGQAIYDTANNRPEVYSRLLEPLDADGRLYVAGDTMSYWPGWQEGAVRSAWWTLAKLRDHVLTRAN